MVVLVQRLKSGIVLSAEEFCTVETNIFKLVYALEQACYSPKHRVKILVIYRRSYKYAGSLTAKGVT